MEVGHTSMIHAAAPHFFGRLRSDTPRISSTSSPVSPSYRPHLDWVGRGRLVMRWRFGSGVRLPLSAILLRVPSLCLCVFSSPPATPLPGSRLPRGRPPPPLASCSLSPAEGGDPAADDTSASRHSLRLETLPGFLPRPSSPPLQPIVVHSCATGGGATRGVGSGGAESGGAEHGGGHRQQLRPQALRHWPLRRQSCRRDTPAPTPGGAAQLSWLADRAAHTITQIQSHMVQQVLQRFRFQFSSPQPTPLPTSHSLSALPSDESLEPSGPYPELVGCLMHGDCAWRTWRVVLTGHSDASWADYQGTQRLSQGYTISLGADSVSWRSTCSSSVLSSSCEAEIYAGAMAPQELRWLTYLLSVLGEWHRSPPVVYVNNKAMVALCWEQRLEHKTKHIALRFFLARELQQRGQLRLAYVASQANTADIFTKALWPVRPPPPPPPPPPFTAACVAGKGRRRRAVE
ncbi:unnamed protein product [Closterium sp. NIES-54]